MECLVEEKVQVQFEPIATSSMRIGIMGGTFNPIHQAHLAMAEQVRKQLHLDEVWFIPDNVKLFEILRGGVSYTVDTLRYLKKRAPKNQYYLIMGTDQINSFDQWREPNEIARLANLVGVKRPNYPTNEINYPVIWVDAPMLEISSTQIRNLVANGGSIRYLVPEAVRLYIDSRGLYRD